MFDESTKRVCRRDFLIKSISVSAAALTSTLIASCRSSAPPTPDSSVAKSPNSSPQQSSSKGLSGVPPLRVAIQGSFALFFGKSNVQIYAPPVSGHFFQVCTGDMKTCDIDSNPILTLTSTDKDYSLSGITTPAKTPPTFNKQTATDNIDPTKSPVYYGNISRPTSYYVSVTLPLPDDVKIDSGCYVDPDVGDILLSPPFKLQRLTLMHTLIYNNYDPTALALISKKSTTSLKNMDHMKIVAEPIQLGNAVNECMSVPHIQRANAAMAKMLGVSSIEIDSAYCRGVSAPALARTHASAVTRSKGGGGTAVGASRLPACMSMLVNDTGTGGGS